MAKRGPEKGLAAKIMAARTSFVRTARRTHKLLVENIPIADTIV